MNCPLCDVELRRVMYEDLAVFQCGTCHGHLMAFDRMKSVERVEKRSVEELKREATDEAWPDTQEAVRCPRCRKKMAKRRLPDPVSLRLDVCAECDLVWLDGGELARAQLGRRISPQGRESAELRRRFERQTPEQREELQRQIDALPDDDSSFSASLRHETLNAVRTWLWHCHHWW